MAEELEGLTEEEFSSIDSWVIAQVDDWNDHYRQNYEKAFEEYYRLWRGIWAEEDKTRQSERSTLISPALQQAVESSVAEIEEATFGRGAFFNIRDDIKFPDSEPTSPEEAQMLQAKADQLNQEKLKIQYLRDKLSENFNKAKIRKAVGECLLNSAVYGTGIAEIVVDVINDVKPSEQVVDGMTMQGVENDEKTIVKLRPIQPQNFKIDPLASSIEDSLGVAIDEFVSPHKITQLQEQGVYLNVPVGMDPYESDNIEKDPTLIDQPDDKVRLTKYFGLVPKHLLDRFTGTDIVEDAIEKAIEEEIEKDSDVVEAEATMVDGNYYVEAMVIIANRSVVLKAQENPYYMKDRPIVAFQWDIVPNRFWGRGVCEKGYSSQKALDAELRARIDALALTNAPMMAMDSTRMPRGARPEIRPGRILLTNGDPNEVLRPFNFGQVSQITFAQAESLQRLVQTATGAIDSAGIPGSINGEATAAGISMSLGAIIKRHKRTLVNFQESFLIPMVKMSAHRYMQFDPERYPVNDYQFEVQSSLGIVAREYEVSQLVQLLQTMGNDTPVYGLLIKAIIENMQLANREELIKRIDDAQKPNPEAEEMRQAIQQAELAVQQAQINVLNGQANEFNSRSMKYEAETAAIPLEVENDRIKANAQLQRADGELSADDKRIIETSKLEIQERKVGTEQAKLFANRQ